MSEKPDQRPLGAATTLPIERRLATGGGSTAQTSPMPRIDPLVGRTLNGRFKVIELLAKGGMGRVYRGEQSPLGRAVALKVLDGSDEIGQDAEFRGRFILEAAATAKLAHPNTVRIFDYGQTDDDIFYIAMEHLEGRTLHQALKDDGALAPERVVQIMRQVCASLREAHGLGLIHRDLKPSNVMLLRTGEEAEFVKVLDFGLVKEVSGNNEFTRVDAVVGSPSYMSPEQIRSGRIDARSDIYSLGVLMYTCLSGKPPFSGTNSVNLLMAHLHTPVPPIAERANLKRAPVLEWIVMRCLEKEAGARFATVDDLSRALRLAAAELRGERPARPTLDSEGHLVVADEPTPSAAARMPFLINRNEPSATLSSGRLSGAKHAKPKVGFPLWVPIGVGLLAVVGVGLIVMAAGGWYMGSQISAPATPTAHTPLAAPVVAPAPRPALPGSQPASPTVPAAVPTAEVAKPKSVKTGGTSTQAAPVAAGKPVEPKPDVAPATTTVKPAAERPLSDVRDPWEDP